MGVATNAELASPGCATPSGFLSLLTLYSTLIRTALFHAESVHGVEALRGFPLPFAATAFTARCPSIQRRHLDDLRICSAPKSEASSTTVQDTAWPWD
jgi:hypothetical protein